MKDDDDDRAWHLDKRVPIAVILTMVLQTAGAVWWAASVSYRIDFLERRDAATTAHSDRIVRLEANMEAIRENLVEIRNLLRQRQATDR